MYTYLCFIVVNANWFTYFWLIIKLSLRVLVVNSFELMFLRGSRFILNAFDLFALDLNMNMLLCGFQFSQCF
jgi:hypothetical protein